MTVTVTPTLGPADQWTETTTPVGPMMVIGDEEAVHFVHLPDSYVRAAFDGDRAGLPAAVAAAVEQIEAYFAGALTDFSLPLDPTGTDFQRRVWLALADIPYGATESYGQLASRVGNPKACRAVGLANGRNPIPLVLPCHRVIGSNGSLTGYGGGLALKQRLLDHERSSSPPAAAAPAAPGAGRRRAS
jgi:methylated-DNA-[protein]-cysteine S-methyltransferase